MFDLSYWNEFDFIAGIVYFIIAVILSLKMSTKRMFFFLLSIFHFFITLYYWSYSLTNVADSTMYFETTKYTHLGWFDIFGPDTSFIRFILFPFLHFFNLNYLGAFFIFSTFGLLGFYFLFRVLLVIVSKNNYKWLYVLFLPQLHFWTCALGKDSLIFMQMSLLLSLWFFNKKLIYYLLPFAIIGFVRIHISLLMVVGYGIAIFLLDSKKISPFKKVLLVGVFGGIFMALFPYLADRINVNNVMEIVEYANNESVKYVSSGGSSVDLSSSSLPIKFFSYLFRPLFFDIWSFLALEASVENLFWLYMFFVVSYSIFRDKKYYSINKFNVLAPYLVAMIIVIPMSYTLSNLGIAMRQKTMIFPLLFHLFIYYKSYKNRLRYE
ncbi:hypothetical protein JSO59_004750 [Riemerella anatipestifer]|uniref:hypothetical protein n=1 Tax=Riemerella anatipestifer TaxID=34085 RepID=UPI0021D585F2|nr:hypothetical protein [Riemerella anatipestifer]MCU7540856.1 hypothetical protein [Riemerella anatipestifer]